MPGFADKYGFGAENDLLPVEIAIPRLEGSGTAPAPEIGNTSAGQTGENGEQQIVLRRTDATGSDHYLLLNGESEDAYERGEGHEQPDQLQLLYYVDGTSFLMDSGYDSVPGAGNSTWNHYYDHNTMQGLIGKTGGLSAPELSEFKLRKDINRVDVDQLYRTRHGNVDVLHGAQRLPYAIPMLNGTTAPITTYREAFFINDDAHPYLIDFQRVVNNATFANMPSDKERFFKVSYHVPSTGLSLSGFQPDGGPFIDWSDVEGDATDLYTYPIGIEYPPRVSTGDIAARPDDAREQVGPDNEIAIQRLDVKNNNTVAPFPKNYYRFSVASILQTRTSPPPHSPRLLWSYDVNGDYQGWVWKQSPDVYDVFVARSVAVTTSPTPLTFTLRDADSSFPAYHLNLPAGTSYGFARVVQQGGQWQVDPNYQVNLNATTPALTVTVSGPNSINEGEQGTWPASASGGTGVYDYTWQVQPTGTYWMNVCTNAPSCAWGPPSGSVSETLNARIRVTVASGGLSESAEKGFIIENTDPADCNALSTNQICFGPESDATAGGATDSGDAATNAAAKMGPAGPTQSLERPEAFALEGSYPNPTRGRALVRYALPKTADVELVVYDVQGREIARPAIGIRPAGVHEVTLDMAGWPSGTYLYRLRAGAHVATGRLVVVR